MSARGRAGDARAGRELAGASARPSATTASTSSARGRLGDAALRPRRASGFAELMPATLPQRSFGLARIVEERRAALEVAGSARDAVAGAVAGPRARRRARSRARRRPPRRPGGARRRRRASGTAPPQLVERDHRLPGRPLGDRRAGALLELRRQRSGSAHSLPTIGRKPAQVGGGSCGPRGEEALELLHQRIDRRVPAPIAKAGGSHHGERREVGARRGDSSEITPP